MDDEDWVEVAINDNAMVVDLLLQLSKAAAPLPTPPIPKLAWSVRQRRSKHAMRHQMDTKKGEPARASPTTPLSWSGATSASGGALDGFEESSKPKNSARSKVSVRREATTSKRPRKKKTLAQLKEEVDAQMREKIYLRNELAALRLTYEKETSINERLKRLQLHLQSQQTMKSLTTGAASGDAISHRLEQFVAVCEPMSVLPTRGHSDKPDSMGQLCPSNECCKLEEAEKKVSAFTLPDLNLSLEEDVAC